MLGRFILALGAVAISGLGPGQTAAQTGINSLSEFAATDVSSTELHVGITSTYNGVKGTDHVFVTAAAIQPNGVAVPRLVNDITRAIVSVGSGRALTVLRMEPPPTPARSTQVEVCLQHRFNGDILCRTFRHSRAWGIESRPPAPPEPPNGNGTCTVMGQVAGPLRVTVRDHRDGRNVARTSVMTEMLMVSRDGTQLRAPLKGRDYVFSNVPAGKLYVVSAGRFRSNPETRRIDCRRNFTFRNVDFTITGGPTGD